MNMSERFSLKAYEEAKAQLRDLQKKATSIDTEPKENDGPDNRRIVSEKVTALANVEEAVHEFEEALTKELQRFGVRWSTDALVKNGLDNIRRSAKHALFAARKSQERAESALKTEHSTRVELEKFRDVEVKEMRSKQATIIAKAKESARKQLMRERSEMKKEMEKSFHERWKKEVGKIESSAERKADEKCTQNALEMDAKIADIEECLKDEMKKFHLEKERLVAEKDTALYHHILDRREIVEEYRESVEIVQQVSSRIEELEKRNEELMRRQSSTTTLLDAVEGMWKMKVTADKDVNELTEKRLIQQVRQLHQRVAAMKQRHVEDVVTLEQKQQAQLDEVYAKVKRVVQDKDNQIKFLKSQIEQSLEQVYNAVHNDP